MMLASPLGFVALLTGWYVTEIGRQPWVIQGVLKTNDAVSTTLTGAEATGTLVAFIVLYLALLTAFGFVLKWMIEGELERMGVRETDRSSRPRMPWVGGDD
jgi:cytochrome d ubiquinol oxidase subunit I